MFGGHKEVRGISDERVEAQISSSLHSVIYWRLGVPIALAAAMMRAGGLGHLLGGLAWYALQFGPLVLLGLAQAVGWIKSRGEGSSGRRALAVLLPALLLVGLAAASSLWANDPGQTLRQAGLLAIVFLFLLSTYAFRWRSREVLHADLQTVFWTGITLQAVGVVGYFLGQSWAVGGQGRFIGVTPNANYAGMSAAILVALAFCFPGPWAKLAGLIPLAGLVLSDSRGSLIGLLIGLLCLLATAPSVRRKLTERMWAISIIVGTPLAFWLRSLNLFSGLRARMGGPATGSSGDTATAPPDDVTSGRLDIYRQYFDAWTQQPWLGTGYRSPTVKIEGLVFEAHNVYLSVLVELGIVGAVVFLALLVGMLRSAAPRVPLIGAAVTALAAEFTESSIFGLGGPAAVMSWIVLFAWAATGLQWAGKADAMTEVGPTGVAPPP